MGAGGGGIYLSLHCHHQNDSCIKMGRDESHSVNVSLIVRDKVTKQCPHWDHNSSRERRAEAESNRCPACLTARPHQLTRSKIEVKAIWMTWHWHHIRPVELHATGEHRVASSRGVQPADPVHGWPQLVTIRDCKDSCGLDFSSR